MSNPEDRRLMVVYVVNDVPVQAWNVPFDEAHHTKRSPQVNHVRLRAAIQEIVGMEQERLSSGEWKRRGVS